jgi:hypothetical protein
MRRYIARFAGEARKYGAISGLNWPVQAANPGAEARILPTIDGISYEARRNRAEGIQDQIPAFKFEIMAKTQTKQLVICIDNKGYAVSLEKRKIYIALRDTTSALSGCANRT